MAYTQRGTTCVHFWGIISSVPPAMIWEKFACWRDRNDLKKFRALCVTVYCSRDTQTSATSISHQHGTSCPCALRVPLESSQKGRRRCLSAAMGSLALGMQSPLPSLSTSLTCFLLVKAELQGSEEWRIREPNCQATAGISQGLNPDTRPGTASSGTFVSRTIPLVFPSMCWIFFKSFVNKSPFCLLLVFFSQQAWGREVRAEAGTPVRVLMATLAGKGQPKQDV